MLYVRCISQMRQLAAECGFTRRQLRRSPVQQFGGKITGQPPDGCTFDIPLAAGNLSGEYQMRAGLQPQKSIQQDGRLDENIL